MESFELIRKIEKLYTYQAGNYIDFYENNKKLKEKYSCEIARVINELGDFENIVEAGVGEATTLGNLIPNLKNKDIVYYGFDISWSRIKYGRMFLKSRGLKCENLFVGNSLQVPLQENSIDVVYTSNALSSLELKSGQEVLAIEELYRVASKYLILIEPMLKGEYVTSLFQKARKLGYEVVEHRELGVNIVNSNPIALMVIKKNGLKISKSNVFCCPITKLELQVQNGIYCSEDFKIVYPIIQGIPCLAIENSI